MLVIHIGPRKTATTYLQTSFHRHRRHLWQRGWLYPQVALHVQSAHHEVVAAKEEIMARKGRMFKRLMRAARKAQKRGANMLLSSESFTRWSAADLRALGDLLGQEKVLVVYTLRDPVTRLPSLWGESIKNGRKQTFPDFVDRALARPMQSPALNPLVELGPFIDHHGLDLLVLNYEAIRAANADLYETFCAEVLGITDLGLARIDPANSSFSAEINEFLRLLARQMNYDPANRSMMFARLFQHSHSTTEIAAIEELIRTSGKHASLIKEIDRSQSWFADLDFAISGALDPYLRPQRSAERLFAATPVSVSYYDGELLAQVPEIAAELNRSAERLNGKKLLWRRSRAQEYWRRLKRLFVI